MQLKSTLSARSATAGQNRAGQSPTPHSGPIKPRVHLSLSAVSARRQARPHAIRPAVSPTLPASVRVPVRQDNKAVLKALRTAEWETWQKQPVSESILAPMASFHREARLDTLALFAITAIAGVAIAVALRTGLDFSSQLERLLHAGRVLFQ